MKHVLKEKPQSKLSDMGDSGEVKDLVHFRKYDQNKLVIAYLNINSLEKKIELLKKTNSKKC